MPLFAESFSCARASTTLAVHALLVFSAHVSACSAVLSVFGDDDAHVVANRACRCETLGVLAYAPAFNTVWLDRMASADTIHTAHWKHPQSRSDHFVWADVVAFAAVVAVGFGVDAAVSAVLQSVRADASARDALLALVAGMVAFAAVLYV